MRYIKIFFEQCKMSLMSASIFRANFILMLIQSIINSLMSVLCVEFIYGSVDSIVGWTKNEMIILICTSLVVNQLYRGLINPNQMRFLTSVSNGSFDKILLRPISTCFQINTGSIDISSLLSSLAPVIIIIWKLELLNTGIGISAVVLYVLFVINGVVVVSSFMMMLYSLAFRFIKVDGLSNIYFMMTSISEKPKEIFEYKSIIMSFIFLIPTIPLANAPASVLLGKENTVFMIVNLCAGLLFFFTSKTAIGLGIKNYCSAGS